MRDEVDEARRNIEITKIFSVGVSDYDHLRPLSGPTFDLRKIRSIFLENQDTSLYDESQFIESKNIKVRYFLD